MVKNSVICPICKNKRDIKILTPGEFNLYLCRICKNGFIFPIPKNLSDYYPKLYWQHLGRFSNIRNWLHNSFQKSRTRWLKKYLTHGDILDVGSGEGIFGEMLGDKYKITNLEYPGASIRNKSVLKLNFLSWKTKKQFDGIVFLESLEHVTNPLKYLKRAVSLLKKEGYIFVEYPKFSCLESRILGKYWLNRDIPRHLFHFTEEGLRNIAKKANLKAIVQRGVMSYQYSPYCLLASIIQILKLPSLNLRLGVIRNLPTLLFLLVGAPLSFIVEAILYLAGESPVGLIVLRKK